MKVKNLGEKGTSRKAGLSGAVLAGNHLLDLLHGSKVDRPKTITYERSGSLNMHFY